MIRLIWIHARRELATGLLLAVVGIAFGAGLGASDFGRGDGRETTVSYELVFALCAAFFGGLAAVREPPALASWLASLPLRRRASHGGPIAAGALLPLVCGAACALAAPAMWFFMHRAALARAGEGISAGAWLSTSAALGLWLAGAALFGYLLELLLLHEFAGGAAPGRRLGHVPRLATFAATTAAILLLAYVLLPVPSFEPDAGAHLVPAAPWGVAARGAIWLALALLCAWRLAHRLDRVGLEQLPAVAAQLGATASADSTTESIPAGGRRRAAWAVWRAAEDDVPGRLAEQRTWIGFWWMVAWGGFFAGQLLQMSADRGETEGIQIHVNEFALWALAAVSSWTIFGRETDEDGGTYIRSLPIAPGALLRSRMAVVARQVLAWIAIVVTARLLQLDDRLFALVGQERRGYLSPSAGEIQFLLGGVPLVLATSAFFSVACASRAWSAQAILPGALSGFTWARLVFVELAERSALFAWCTALLVSAVLLGVASKLLRHRIVGSRGGEPRLGPLPSSARPAVALGWTLASVVPLASVLLFVTRPYAEVAGMSPLVAAALASVACGAMLLVLSSGRMLASSRSGSARLTSALAILTGLGWVLWRTLAGAGELVRCGECGSKRMASHVSCPGCGGTRLATRSARRSHLIDWVTSPAGITGLLGLASVAVWFTGAPVEIQRVRLRALPVGTELTLGAAKAPEIVFAGLGAPIRPLPRLDRHLAGSFRGTEPLASCSDLLRALNGESGAELHGDPEALRRAGRFVLRYVPADSGLEIRRGDSGGEAQTTSVFFEQGLVSSEATLVLYASYPDVSREMVELVLALERGDATRAQLDAAVARGRVLIEMLSTFETGPMDRSPQGIAESVSRAQRAIDAVVRHRFAIGEAPALDVLAEIERELARAKAALAPLPVFLRPSELERRFRELYLPLRGLALLGDGARERMARGLADNELEAVLAAGLSGAGEWFEPCRAILEREQAVLGRPRRGGRTGSALKLAAAAALARIDAARAGVVLAESIRREPDRGLIPILGVTGSPEAIAYFVELDYHSNQARRGLYGPDGEKTAEDPGSYALAGSAKRWLEMPWTPAQLPSLELWP